MLGDQRYRVSSSSFCDYEVGGEPPRSLHKIVTLCCVYAISFRSLLVSIGIPVDGAGPVPMPDHLVGRYPPKSSVSSIDQSGPTGSGFLEQLLEDWREVPFFMRR